MYKLFLVILLCTSSAPLLAQNLVDIFHLAEQNDATLKIAQADFEAASQSLPIAASVRQPQVNLSAQQSLLEKDNSNTGSNTNQNLGYTLSLTQTIYNVQTSAQVDSAESSVQQAAANLEEHQIIAVGDGANDIPMLNGAGIGVGYHAFPTARDAADVAITHGDLTALLYLQGIKISDFVV